MQAFPGPALRFQFWGRTATRYHLDMGWEDGRVAVEYDGKHHTDHPIYSKDIIRLEYLNSVGWIVIRVVAGHRRAEVVHRVRQAWAVRRR